MTIEGKVRVFVGCAPNGEDVESQAVLEYTLVKHASVPVEITWMRLTKEPGNPFFSHGASGWQTVSWSTPFSGFRWAVPALCDFTGRAVYCDSDVMFMADVAELWRQPIPPGKAVLAKGGADSWRFCVALFDCAAMRTLVPSLGTLQRDPRAHAGMIAKMKVSPAVGRFVGNWNCIDGENYVSLHDPDIKVIHYSSEAHQPHLAHALPRLKASGQRHWFDGRVLRHWRPDLIELFNKNLSEAEAAGYVRGAYVPAVRFGPVPLMSHAGYSSHRWAKRA